MKKYTNKIMQGDALTKLKELPDESINCSISSPPYWSLRDYSACDCTVDVLNPARTTAGPIKCTKGKKPDPNCLKCGGTGKNTEVAKKQLGLEPTIELYIDHLCTIYDEVKRVLRKDGTCWVNLGDTYMNNSSRQAAGRAGFGNDKVGMIYKSSPTIKEKSLCMIPQRFAQAMSEPILKCLYCSFNGRAGKWGKWLNGAYSLCPKCGARQKKQPKKIADGWILRNVIIWSKPNPMPSSAKDRFTVDFEYVFFFVKSNTTQYWLHIRTHLMVDKKPRPDYRWQHASGSELKAPPDDPCWKEKRVVCPDCKGAGKVRPILNTPFFKGMAGKPEVCGRCLSSREDPDVKNYTVPEWQRVNLWEGHDYFFESQYEPYLTESNLERPRMGQGQNTQYEQKRKEVYTGQNTKDYASAKAQSPSDSKRRILESIQNNPLGRNKRTTWTIPTEAFPEAHFATFPRKLVEPMIKAGCPRYVCTKCGTPRRKVYEKGELVPDSPQYKPRGANKPQLGVKTAMTPAGCTQGHPNFHYETKFKGYSDCGCENPIYKPGIVLDMFGGSCTTGEVAYEHGRDYVMIELSPEYVKIAEKRINKKTEQYSLIERS